MSGIGRCSRLGSPNVEQQRKFWDLKVVKGKVCNTEAPFLIDPGLCTSINFKDNSFAFLKLRSTDLWVPLIEGSLS